MSISPRSQIKSALFDALAVNLSTYGFKHQRARDRFVRKRGDVTDFLGLVCLDGKPGLRVQPNVGIRVEQIEKIFHDTSGFEKKYQSGTATMGGSVGGFIGRDTRDCEYEMQSISQVSEVSSEILKMFVTFGLKYFDRWGSIASIDAELNDRPGARTHHRAVPWMRDSTAIIAAKLSGRANYDDLAEFYKEDLTRSDNGFYLGRFIALLESLQQIAPVTVTDDNT